MAKSPSPSRSSGARSIPAPKPAKEGPRTGGHTSNNGNGKMGC